MIATPEKFDRMIGAVANAAPISDDFLRSLFPPNNIVLPEEMLLAAAMKSVGLQNELVEAVFDQYRRLKTHIVSSEEVLA